MQQQLSPTERAFLIALLLIGSGYALHSEKFLFFAMLVAATLSAAWLWYRFALRGLVYRRHFSERRAFVGETVRVTLSVANRKWLPLPRLRIDDYCSTDLTFTDVTPEISHIPGLSIIRQYFSLSWLERQSRTYHLDCRRRGLYTFPQVRIETGDPFGFFSVRTEFRQEDRFIVYPQVKPVAGLDFIAKEVTGPRVADRRLLEDPVFLRGVRPYQPQDDLRHIHWKASAHTRRLQTKLFEPTTDPSLLFFVNIATYSRRWQGVNPERLEHVVSVAASLCAHAVERRLLVGLSANGTVYRSDQPLRVLPSRSPRQLTRLLEMLAGVRGYAGLDFETLLLRDSARLPWGATLVVVTAVVTPELEAVLLRLKQVGRKLMLLSLADAPPRLLPGIVTYHLPPQTAAEVYTFSLLQTA
ncbi:MAG: DUF58 domain-containing protein [Caldilineae bacterium]|nr:MAG: DUF58 domain-containing protein [Caldilineae bacterium]